MRNFTYSLVRSSVELDFTCKSGGFTFFMVLLLMLFQSTSLNAQVGFGTENELQQLISVKNGAKIYSSDKSFNQQIIEKKDELNKTSISYVDVSGKKYLLVAPKKGADKKDDDLTTQIKEIEVKKKKIS